MSPRAKILYVTSIGGVQDYNFLNKLVNDYEVLMLHYGRRNIIPEVRALENSGLKIISRRPRIYFLPLLSEMGHFKKIVRDFKPDIVHTGYVWQVGILASRIDFHPHLSMPWGSDIMLQPEKYFILRKWVKTVMRQCDRILSDTVVVKRKIVEDYKISPEKITVFPWGIDIHMFKPLDRNECRQELGLDKDKFIIIFNRHLAPVYGVQYLLEGFKNFAKGKQNVLLLLYSGGSLYKEAERFVKRNGLEEKIIFFGRIANSKMAVYLNAADVYISTSLSDGASLSLLEAMACGNPGIVVTHLPAIVDWISADSGVVIEPRNPEAVRQALERCYNGSAPPAGAGEINRKIICERADWEKNYLKLREVYGQLIGYPG